MNALVCLNNIVLNSSKDAEQVAKNEGVMTLITKFASDRNTKVNEEAWYVINSLGIQKKLDADLIVS